MGPHRGGNLGDQITTGRLPDSVRLTTASQVPTSRLTTPYVPVTQGSCTSSGVTASLGQGRHRTCLGLPGVLQSRLCGTKGLRGISSNHRPFHSELLRQQDEVQNGDSSNSHGRNSKRRLDGVFGPEGRLSPGSRPSRQQALPPFPVAGVSLPVSCPMLWPLYCPSGLHSSHGPCFSRVSPKGFPSPSLLGRLAGPCFFPDRGTGSHHMSSQSLLRPWHTGELGKVFTFSRAKEDLPGNVYSFPKTFGFSNRGEDSEPTRRCPEVPEFQVPTCVPMVAASGTYGLSHSSSSGLQEENPQAPDCPQPSLVWTQGSGGPFHCLGCRVSTGSGMVAGRPEFTPRSTPPAGGPGFFSSTPMPLVWAGARPFYTTR